MTTTDWLSLLGRPQSLDQRDLPQRWRYLRDAGPAHWAPPTDGRPGFWVIPRYADVQALASDRRLTSSQGNMLLSLREGGDPAGGRLMAVMDPPDHTGLRRIMGGPYFRTFLDTLPRRIDHAATGYLDELLDHAALTDGVVDIAPLLSERLPITVVCELIGVPQADRAWLLARSKDALSADEADTDPVAGQIARIEVVEYFNNLARTPQPGTLLEVLAGTTSADLDREHVALNCYGLLLAGDETTRLTLNSTFSLLARNPQSWEALVSRTVGIDEASEEILRVTSPIAHIARVASEDIQLDDVVIRAGDIVTSWIVSANYDDRVFDDPETLRLNRGGHHLAFGHGPHYCFGSHLAGLQVRAVLRLLRTRLAGLEPAGNPRPIYSSFLRGYASMPIALELTQVAA
ncbi:cytochrome P450 [Nocardia sp. CNY236]|uniref:cytochrome P450 n=1 Tax=Nocardia sp. CNY236 TaxID=1169152 RepID=UPI0018C9AB4D|nr:cytochrome P450 [Nocardia sp. CNY236]